MIVFSLQAVSYLLIATKLPGSSCTCRSGSTVSSRGASLDHGGGDRRFRRAEKGRGGDRFVTFIFGWADLGTRRRRVLAERTGSFSGSFYMAAAFAGVAILLSAFLRKPQSG